MTNETSVDEMLKATMKKIAEAAGRHDLPSVAENTRKAAELEDIKKTLQGIDEKLKKLKEPSSTSTHQSDTKLREFPIEVSQGMLRQNLLTLTVHVQRGRIKTGEELTIEAHPSGEQFRTDLMMNGNKVRERGAIGRFYREAGVHAGDFVVLTEVAPSRWNLKKAPHGKYQSRRSFLNELLN